MTKVLFDHQIFSLQRFGGISRYFANVHHTLKRNNEASSISTLYSPNHYIQDDPGIFGEKLGKLLLPTQQKIYKWNKKYSKYIIRKNNFNVFHPTYYEPYFLKYLKKPFVLTVHDMIHEKFPHYFAPDDVLAAHKRICIEKAAHIIAISQSTKDDIQQYLNIPGERISVIHHGFQPFAIKKNEIVNIPQKYLLFVGERGLYKNFSGFIESVAPLLKKDATLNIVCAGGGIFLPEEKDFLAQHNISGQVSQESVTDAKLLSLYQQAIAFVFPSLYEGFGLPLLEAFNYNCPVITSNTSCFEEVCGEAAIYFDPYSINSMRNQIEKAINNQVLRNALRLKGKERLNHFSIEKSIEQTINIYRKFG